MKDKRKSDELKSQSKFRRFLKKKNIEISAKRYFIDALGIMAQGLFASLLIGTILNTVGSKENSRTLVPLRAVFEVLNCEIDWDESNRSAIVQQKNIKIVIPVNSKTAYVNGVAITLDTPAKIVNGRIMVPLRFISESINKTVIWDSLNSTALIY